MTIGRVTGNLVAMVKIPALNNHKLLRVTAESPEGVSLGKSVIAVDTVKAGVGDRVLIIDEGGSANIVLEGSGLPIRTIIVGIIDEIDN
jgi:ethanolamine utilization protein EutN